MNKRQYKKWWKKYTSNNIKKQFPFMKNRQIKEWTSLLWFNHPAITEMRIYLENKLHQ